jgi:hypothetical protein
MTDTLALPSGKPFRFAPLTGQDLPTKGFIQGDTDYYSSPTPELQPETEVIIRADSASRTVGTSPESFRRQGSGIAPLVSTDACKR